MKKKPSDVFRSQELASARALHDGRCDACGKQVALEYHEIFPRSFTLGNDNARMISYKRELCAFLCRDCHAALQSNHAAGKMLLALNMRRYGVEAVKLAQQMLQEAMNSNIGSLITDNPDATFVIDSANSVKVWGGFFDDKG